jgi:hypothetical protein
MQTARSTNQAAIILTERLNCVTAKRKTIRIDRGQVNLRPQCLRGNSAGEDTDRSVEQSCFRNARSAGASAD